LPVREYPPLSNTPGDRSSPRSFQFPFASLRCLKAARHAPAAPARVFFPLAARAALPQLKMRRARKIHRKIPPARCAQLPESSPLSAIPRIAAFLQSCREIAPAPHALPETWKQFPAAAPHPAPCATTGSAARWSHPTHIRSWPQSLLSHIPRTFPKIRALDASVPPRLPPAVSPPNSESRHL